MKKANTIWIFAALLLLAAALALVYALNAPAPAAGTKHITLQIVHADGAERALRLETQQEYLLDALEEAHPGLITGEEGQYGLFILSVDGETADAALQQWWRITKASEMLNTGIDTTPIADGDQFELMLITGW